MALLATTYCDVAELQRFMSTTAVTDFADHDANGTADADVVEDAINQATEEIDMYARERYLQADLATSELVKRWCVVMAARFLCHRRGNVVPESIEQEFERIADPRTGLLRLVKDSDIDIPGEQLREDLRPTFSNLTIDRRWRRSTVRVTQLNSSDAPSKMSQDLMTETFD
jgi:phage gp36-like protein